MTTTSSEQQHVETARSRIPGWGVDLDPNDRPAVPRELREPEELGAHWTTPVRQPVRGPRERSIEHAELTPVFGTAQPLRGISGAIRTLAYERFSEARAAHWLLLALGDRVDAWEHHVASFASLRPDNPITQTGVKSELTHHGVASRLGKRRADVKHQWLDPLVVAGPWIVGGLVAFRVVRRIVPGGSR